MEVWRDIKDFEGLYQVSNLGRVKSLNYRRTSKEQVLKPRPAKSGYVEAALYKNSKCKYIQTHRLVATAFCENPNNNPQVNHKDGNKQNNKANNLEWCTPSENQRHAFKLGLKKVSGSALSRKMKIKCVDLDITADSIKEMQRILFDLGLTKSTCASWLSMVMRQGNKTYLGLQFVYVKERK